MSLARWVKNNLFDGWINLLLSVSALWLLWVATSACVRWALREANWGVVFANAALLLVGPYPQNQLWRVWTILAALALFAGMQAGGQMKIGHRRTLIAWGVFFSASAWLLSADLAGTTVESSMWGGLLLTLILSTVAIVASFPLGVLLALGRASKLPVVSGACVTYIEVVRGVPLITVLFMAQLMVPLFLPAVRVDKVLRAIIGLTLFSAAYMAENVRGGLQAVPVGQVEAARALGLSGVQTVGLIVLPQALRAVIPALVGQFIALFKDTSLVSIMGLSDLLGIGNSIVANPQWLGLYREVLLVVALIYWVFSFGMSLAARRLEARLAIGQG
jgi:general L-amino acid transport system permease protein